MKNIFKTLLLAGVVSMAATAAYAEGTEKHTGTNSEMRNNQQTDRSDARGSTTEMQGSSQQYSEADVRAVQQNLNNEGFSLPVDGVWGQQTADAIRSFQRANNLTETGTLDSATRAELNVSVNAR